MNTYAHTMGNIGEPKRQIEFEPMPETVPVPEVVPETTPVEEPVPA